MHVKCQSAPFARPELSGKLLCEKSKEQQLELQQGSPTHGTTAIKIVFMRIFPTILLAAFSINTDNMAPKKLLTIQVQYCGG